MHRSKTRSHPAGTVCSLFFFAQRQPTNFLRGNLSAGKTRVFGTPKFELDLTEAPGDAQVQDWATSAKDVCEEWFPLICRFLATDDWTPPQTVRLVFKTEQAAPGSTSGDVIHVSVKWIKAHPDDSHWYPRTDACNQHYSPARSQPGWLVGGVADYLPLLEIRARKNRTATQPGKASYRDGYGTAPPSWPGPFGSRQAIVRRLDDAMRHQRYKTPLQRGHRQRSRHSLGRVPAGPVSGDR